MSATYIHGHFRLDFFMEANSMNPDQTAPKGPHYLQYRLPKNISRQEEQMIKSCDWCAKGFHSITFIYKLIQNLVIFRSCAMLRLLETCITP